MDSERSKAAKKQEEVDAAIAILGDTFAELFRDATKNPLGIHDSGSLEDWVYSRLKELGTMQVEHSHLLEDNARLERNLSSILNLLVSMGWGVKYTEDGNTQVTTPAQPELEGSWKVDFDNALSEFMVRLSAALPQADRTPVELWVMDLLRLLVAQQKQLAWQQGLLENLKVEEVVLPTDLAENKALLLDALRALEVAAYDQGEGRGMRVATPESKAFRERLNAVINRLALLEIGYGAEEQDPDKFAVSGEWIDAHLNALRPLDKAWQAWVAYCMDGGGQDFSSFLLGKYRLTGLVGMFRAANVVMHTSWDNKE